MQTHPNCMALYIVRIPQARVLPRATFRISPRDGHSCLKLIVATANPIADFHCQAITHARRIGFPQLYRCGVFARLKNSTGYFLPAISGI